MNELENNNASLSNIVQQTALNVQAMAQQMGLLVAGFNDLKSHMNVTDQKLEQMDTRMTGWEERERISVSEANRLRKAIHARCFYLLGIEHSNGHVTEDSAADYKRYFGRFCNRCYTDARNKSRLGTPYYDTRKEDYEEVMKYIQDWEPEVSYAGLTGAAAYKLYLNYLQSI